MASSEEEARLSEVVGECGVVVWKRDESAGETKAVFNGDRNADAKGSSDS